MPTNRPKQETCSSGPAFPQRSFWSEDYGPYSPRGSLHGTAVADIVIIGAGFTGLMTAISLRSMDPGTRVIVLEQESVGFGASGRNSGWVWPNLSSFETILSRHGEETLKETYQYTRRACDLVRQLVLEHCLDSDYRDTGILRPSVSRDYEPDRERFAELCQKMGRLNEISEVSETDLHRDYGSPLFHKAFWDRELALIHPVKHVRALANLAESLGAVIYEQSPAINFSESDHAVHVSLPTGHVRADRMVLATNGYTHLLTGDRKRDTRRNQRPIFVYNTVSRPLHENEWNDVGWKKRNAIYTFGPGSHFGSPTSDGRIHWCSDRFVGVPFGNDMSMEYAKNYNSSLLSQTRMFFPSLANLELTHHWGGPVAVTLDQIFHLGHLNGSKRVLLSIGCNGNGVAPTHLNGRILAELLLDKRSDLADLWFVNKRQRRWPSALAGSLAIKGVTAFSAWRSKRRAERAGLGRLIEEQPEVS